MAGVFNKKENAQRAIGQNGLVNLQKTQKIVNKWTFKANEEIVKLPLYS